MGKIAKKGQLQVGIDAKQTVRQHVRPCKDCPWARASLKGWLGPLSAADWLQLAHGEGISECHTRKGPFKNWQCAGIAIYRANVCKLVSGSNMELPKDKDKVFAVPSEFMEHHTGSPKVPVINPIEFARRFFRQYADDEDDE